MVNLQKELEDYIALIKAGKTQSDIQNKLEFFNLKGIQDGTALDNNGKRADAILIYSYIIELFQLVSKAPNPRYYFRRAYNYAELGENDKALADYMKYIELKPNEPSVCNNIALIFCSKGDHVQEFAYFEKALKLNPKYELTYRNMAVCYKDRKEYDKALEAVNKAIEFAPASALAYSVKAEIFEGMKKLDEAISNYEKAVELDKNHEFALNRLKSLRIGGTSEGLTVFKPESANISFKDIVGLDELKNWCKANLLLPLQKPAVAKKYNKYFGGGVLLYGPPGCGKTYFCSALAGEANIKLIKIKISGVFDKWLGNTEKNIANMFNTARQNKPCILFIDEIDGLGGKRKGEYQFLDTAVNQILMEINDINEDKEEILVIGATNAPWYVDDALKRSGRLGKFVYIPPPDRSIRNMLFKKYLESVPLDKKVNVPKLAARTENFSVTDIKSVCEEASGKAFEKACASDKDIPVTSTMLEEALKKERSDLLEWYNSATKMITEEELIEFYGDLHAAILKVRKGTSIVRDGMFG